MSRLVLLPPPAQGVANVNPIAGQTLAFTGVSTKAKPTFQGRYAASGIPMLIAPSGTMGNNGAVVWGTALLNAYAAGGYAYFPASAISAGSAAGWYWFVGTDTTHATVYNNLAPATGAPQPVASPTAFVTTGPGAYVGVTSIQVAVTIPIPGGTLQQGGMMRLCATLSSNNTAGSKTSTIQYGGQTIFAGAQTTVQFQAVKRHIHTRGVQGASGQVVADGGTGNTGIGSGATMNTFYTIDTTVAQNVTFSVTLGTATDTAVLECWSVELMQPTANG